MAWYKYAKTSLKKTLRTAPPCLVEGTDFDSGFLTKYGSSSKCLESQELEKLFAASFVHLSLYTSANDLANHAFVLFSGHDFCEKT